MSNRRTSRWYLAVIGASLTALGLLGGVTTGHVVFAVPLYIGGLCLLIAGGAWLRAYIAAKSSRRRENRALDGNRRFSGWRRTWLISGVASILLFALGLGLAFYGLAVAFSGRPGATPGGGSLQSFGLGVVGVSFLADATAIGAGVAVWRTRRTKFLAMLACVVLASKVFLLAMLAAC